VRSLGKIKLIKFCTVKNSVCSGVILGHMVVDYVKEHNPQLSKEELMSIEEAARNGDITR